VSGQKPCRQGSRSKSCTTAITVFDRLFLCAVISQVSAVFSLTISVLGDEDDGLLYRCAGSKADRMLFRFGGKAFFAVVGVFIKKCIDGGTVCINERTEKNEEENFENSQLRSCDSS